MMERIPRHIFLFHIIGWLAVIGSLVSISGMETLRLESPDRITEKGSRWMPLPRLQSVTTNNGTVLLVRSFVKEALEDGAPKAPSLSPIGGNKWSREKEEGWWVFTGEMSI